MPSRTTKSSNAKRTAQKPKSASAPRKKKPPSKPKVFRPEDHPNFQPDLPAGFLQNTNPNQNQTF